MHYGPCKAGNASQLVHQNEWCITSPRHGNASVMISSFIRTSDASPGHGMVMHRSFWWTSNASLAHGMVMHHSSFWWTSDASPAHGMVMHHNSFIRMSDASPACNALCIIVIRVGGSLRMSDDASQLGTSDASWSQAWVSESWVMH